MIRRNMESVDRDIQVSETAPSIDGFGRIVKSFYFLVSLQQDAVRRLGAAMLDADDDDNGDGLLNVGGCYPDLIPFVSAPPPPATSTKGVVVGQQFQQKTLPPPASPSRKVLLEAVKEVLGKRVSTNKTGPRPEETEATVPLPTLTPTPTPTPTPTSSRIGLFRFQHDEGGTDIKEEATCDKLSRFVCQRMPSVSVEASRQRQHQLAIIPARQQISVAVFDAQSSDDAASISRPTTPEPKSIKDELPPLPLLPAKLNDMIEPDELAQMVCDLLSDQVHLAFDSFTADCVAVEVINYLLSSSMKSICLCCIRTLPSFLCVCRE